MKKPKNHISPTYSPQRKKLKAEPFKKNEGSNSYETPHATDKKSRKTENPSDIAVGRWTKIVGVFTAVLAITGMIQTWAFIQSARAFISILSLTLDGGIPQAESKSIRIFFQVKNSGRSTAFSEHTVVNMKIGSMPKDVAYVEENQIAVPPIPPNDIANDHDVIAFSRPVTGGESDAIKAGTLRISFFGYIRYSDDFGFLGKKTIGFCFTYSAVPTGASPFDTCPESEYTYVK